ncbi:MAG: hypothetical protein E7678_02545 [Ruminococcaceae bacterium]|nr:hypothetical protein [Oscillospiraceae bacterium]
MKKTTKKITTVVAVLLILVLMTSSIVSGTLAKFVVTKSASTNVSFTNFGITVNFEADSDIAGTLVNNGDSATYALKNIAIKPGDDFSDAVTISVTGTTTVQTKVTITAVVDYVDTNFDIPANTITGVSTRSVFMPVGFKVNGNYVSNLTPYKSYTYNANTSTDTTVETALETAIATASGLSYSGGVATKTFNVGDTINISNLVTGFDWPMQYNAVANSDQIGTWLSLHKTPSFTVTYTVTVEQVA